MNLTRSRFGKCSGGRDADLFTIKNKNGFEARITNFGGIVVSILAPDRTGALADVLLGFDRLGPYLTQTVYFNSIIGRYGNRIANGKFLIDKKEYTLARNNGPNHLHGGLKGFDKVLWKAREIKGRSARGVELSYVSPDGEEGYPGRLSATVTYLVTEKNELSIEYSAQTSRKTVVNLTNHAYFNLSGDFRTSVLSHELYINADRFTPVDTTMIPTGELRSVKNTPLDFTKPTAIGRRIKDQYDQLVMANGYDHNFVLKKPRAGSLSLAARARDPSSGRVLEVFTTEPGVQLYTGNFLDGSSEGKGGVRFQKRSGFCLETQHFPDSPNKPTFPSTVLKPGQKYKSKTIYAFSVSN